MPICARRRLFFFPPPVSDRIMRRIWRYWRSNWLTCCTDVPPPLSDAPSPPTVDDLVVEAFLEGHRADDRFNARHFLRVDVDVLQPLQRAYLRQHPENRLQRAELLELL